MNSPGMKHKLKCDDDFKDLLSEEEIKVCIHTILDTIETLLPFDLLC